MPKISISNVVDKINEAKETIKGIASSFSIEYSKNKSAKIDGTTRNVMEHFLPLFVIVSCEYYLIDGSDGNISTKKKELLTTLKTLLLKEWVAGGEKEDVALSYIKKFPYDMTKKQFFSSRVAIQNDNSIEHLQAFNVDSVRKIPRRNVLLKLINASNTHLRMGISFENEKVTIFKIIAIEKKSVGN